MKVNKNLLLLVTLSFFLQLPVPAEAIYGGESALGDNRILTLATQKDSRSPFCSMAMITERIVVTAAHCMAKPDAIEELRFNTQDLYVSKPGVDFRTDPISDRVKVAQVVLPKGYANFYNPATGDQRTSLDDIAFLFLETHLVPGYKIQVATNEEVSALKAERQEILHFGYGLQDLNIIDGKPYKVNLRIRPRTYAYELDNAEDENKTIITDENGSKALCAGDSGGPWYGLVNGSYKLVAVTVGASGCNGPNSGRGGTFGTLISPYLDFMWQEWNKYLINETKIRDERIALEKKQQEEELSKLKALTAIEENAKNQGTYLLSEGCHARGINAELQSQSENGSWEFSSSTSGWIERVGCPDTNPVAPWTIVNAKSGSNLRWRYWSNTWDVFGSPFVWIQQSPKIALQPEESKVLVVPSPTKFSIQRITITCKKGKIEKRITGNNPTCPTGYKRIGR
jgi:hypothetical protein